VTGVEAYGVGLRDENERYPPVDTTSRVSIPIELDGVVARKASSSTGAGCDVDS